MLPLITITIICVDKSSFFEINFNQIINLNYPKDRIILIIYSYSYQDIIKTLIKDKSLSTLYYQIFNYPIMIPPFRILQESFKINNQNKSLFNFYLPISYHITEPNLITNLIKYNEPIIGIKDSITYSKSGISGLFLVKNEKQNDFYQFYLSTLNSNQHDISNISFKLIKNNNGYGFLLSVSDKYKMKQHPSLFCFEENRQLWEKYYLDPIFLQHYHNTISTLPFSEPIPFLFQFPLFNERFCQHLIEEMEFYGKWSGGTHNDIRLAGGHENVPTRDIHLYQIGFGDIWKQFVKEYIYPWARVCFPGIQFKGTNIDFVVKYTTQGQPSLKPHHDSSSYSINIALNQRCIDFQGGGTKFIKSGYHHTTQKKGWCLMHPGRVTHYHEGVGITSGTRYILVSFVE